MMHPLLRTVMLPSELLNKRDHVFKVRIGHPLSSRNLCAFPDDAKMTSYLRWRTYLLGERQDSGKPPAKWTGFNPFPHTPRVVAARTASGNLEREIQTLPSDQILMDGGDDCVVLAKAGQIPQVMREIGRLREIAFRSVGEGTGKKIDLDPFDEYYDHLFVWRKSQSEILGA